MMTALGLNAVELVASTSVVESAGVAENVGRNNGCLALRCACRGHPNIKMDCVAAVDANACGGDAVNYNSHGRRSGGASAAHAPDGRDAHAGADGRVADDVHARKHLDADARTHGQSPDAVGGLYGDGVGL